MTPDRIAVVGATGPTGIYLTRALVERGLAVRVISRHEDRLREAFRDLEVEIAPGQALDPSSLERAVAGCGLVAVCIGLPPKAMDDHPRVASNVVRAARHLDARCLHVSSYWSFFPHRGEVVGETHPRVGGHDWFRWRREAEEIFLAAGASVAHLPDFYGPKVHTSAVQGALDEAVSSGVIHAIGTADTQREAAFVPEAMRVVADLALRPEAYGTDWGIPGNGLASPNRLAEIAAEQLGREVRVRSVPPWLLRLLALVVPSLRPVVPLAPHYAKPVRYDTSKLESLLGEPRLSPFDETVRTTLDWIVSERF